MDLIFYKCLKCGSDDVCIGVYKDEIILECVKCGYTLTTKNQEVEIEVEE